MPSIAERNYVSDLVKYEEERLDYSRNVETVAAGQNLTLGTVLGQKTAGGKLYALDPAATDGTQNAYGVLLQDTDATLIDRVAVVIARHAVLADRAVIWPAGITASQKAAALGQLEAKGILIRSAA